MIEFKIALMRAGLKLSDLAPKLGVSRRYLNYVVTGHRKSLDIRNRLVVEFGLPPEAVFPPPQHKYQQNARPREMKKNGNVSKALHA